MARPTSGTYDSKLGDKVLIQMDSRSPYGGRIGVVVEINDGDVYGPILVRFTMAFNSATHGLSFCFLLFYRRICHAQRKSLITLLPIEQQRTTGLLV